MPDPDDDVITIEPGDGDEIEKKNQTIALTAMGNEFGAAAANRVRRSDQLSGDSQAM